MRTFSPSVQSGRGLGLDSKDLVLRSCPKYAVTGQAPGSRLLGGSSGMWVELFALNSCFHSLAPAFIHCYCCAQSTAGPARGGPPLREVKVQARVPGAGSMCRGGAPAGSWAFRSRNPTFPPMHLWPLQPQLLPILFPHPTQDRATWVWPNLLSQNLLEEESLRQETTHFLVLRSTPMHPTSRSHLWVQAGGEGSRGWRPSASPSSSWPHFALLCCGPRDSP